MGKMLCVLLVAFLPSSSYAQMPGGQISIIPIALILLGVALLVFFLCRNIMCWYWKINRHLENQEKIINLLGKLINDDYSSYVGRYVEVCYYNGSIRRGEVYAINNEEHYLSITKNDQIVNVFFSEIKYMKEYHSV